MSKKWLAAIGIYAGLVLICLVAVYAVPSLKGMLDRTYVAENGKLDITDRVSAYIVRDETVYVAGKSGAINRLAETDKLVKAGTRIIELTEEEKDTSIKLSDSGSRDISTRYVAIVDELDDSVIATDSGKCKNAGYVSYYVDGAETALGTDRLADLNRSDLETYSAYSGVETPKRSCTKGEPVFKVVNNSKWYLVFYIDNEASDKYYEGSYVNIDVNGEPIRVQVSGVYKGDESAKVILTCKTFFDGFLEERKLDTVVTVASAEGLKLRDSSIVKDSEGRRGVFIKNKIGKHIFKPVALKADDGDNSVAYSDIFVDEGGNFVETIRTYDEIVEHPTDEDLKSIGAAAADENKDKDEKADEAGSEEGDKE